MCVCAGTDRRESPLRQVSSISEIKVRTGYYHECLDKKLKHRFRPTNHDFIRNMALVLKDFDHVTVVEGELVPQSHAFDLENLIGNFDYKRVIRMQFDRLDSAFQEFLKVHCRHRLSSCLYYVSCFIL